MKVAIVTQDVFGDRLAGPAIRALAMGRALAAEGHEVQVHSTGGAASSSDLVVAGRLASGTATAIGRSADVVVVQGDVLDACPGLGRGTGALVADLYDPFELEGLVRGVDLPVRARYGATRRALSVLSGQLARGDLFLCASERQRLFWLGHLDAAGRINPATYDADPTLARLLAVVPFGID
ncbi:MAG: glycosyltransferase family 1 protein, partial [Acidimicrobiales bacterium]